MNFPRTISAAVEYLAAHPELHADPSLLMAACEQWSEVLILKLDQDTSLLCPITRDMVESALHQAGINAAKEVAMPCKTVVVDELINPEDLSD